MGGGEHSSPSRGDGGGLPPPGPDPPASPPLRPVHPPPHALASRLAGNRSRAQGTSAYHGLLALGLLPLLSERRLLFIARRAPVLEGKGGGEGGVWGREGLIAASAGCGRRARRQKARRELLPCRAGAGTGTRARTLTASILGALRNPAYWPRHREYLIICKKKKEKLRHEQDSSATQRSVVRRDHRLCGETVPRVGRRQAAAAVPRVFAVCIAVCLALSAPGAAGATGMALANNAANYVTILGAGPEMQPACCVSTSKVMGGARAAAGRRGLLPGRPGGAVRGRPRGGSPCAHAVRRRGCFSTARRVRSG